MKVQTGLQQTEMIYSILNYNKDKMTTLSLPIQNRMSLIEAMAQTASLHLKKEIDFQKHTFLASIRNLFISPKATLFSKEKNLSVFIVATPTLLYSGNGNSYQVEVLLPDNTKKSILAKAKIMILEKEWDKNFKENLIKESSRKRFFNLQEKGKRNDKKSI